MATVTISIAGRNYQVGCGEGQEEQVRTLGKDLDRRARMLSEATGATAETLVLVLTALMVADEVQEARLVRATAERERDGLRAKIGVMETELQQTAAEPMGGGRRVVELGNKVSELEAQLTKAQGDLGDARAALAQAHEHLEQRRDDQAARQQLEEDLAESIEALASRVETVADSFRAP